jgi:ABC-type lipoprotein export system ATPase subunit
VKTYRPASGEVRALRGVDATFAAARTTVVAGPSGSGKSSLLRILAGIDRPSSGSATVGGVRLERAGAGRLRRLRAGVVGTVLQRPSDNFFPHLSLGDHLALAMRKGRRGAAVDAGELVGLLGLGDRLGHRPDELSGGEQQRGAFAQVVLTGASIVVADEPTAELDLESSGHLLDAVGALVTRGVTFILSSHDADVIARADAVIRLDHGLVADAHGTPSLARTHPREAPLPAPAALRWAAPGGASSTGAAWPDERAIAVEVRGVTKTFHRGEDAVHAVRDASVDIGEGEFVGLIGRSGSGKTTLLNIMAGWEDADEGIVALADGRTVDRSAPWSEIAVLPQRLGLIEELTVRENIEYPARLSGSLEATADATDELVDILGLFALQRRYPRETSVGEQQRVALARALILAPRVILADEPTGHQDGAHARDMLEAIRRTVARGSACVAATHSQELLRYLDRVLTMADGRLGPDPG